MAFFLGRAAAAAARRISKPAIGSQLPHLGRNSFRPSFRTSDELRGYTLMLALLARGITWKSYEKLAEQVNGMTVPQAVYAKRLIDMKLGKAGVVELTGDDAFRAFREEMRQSMKAQKSFSAAHQKMLLELANKKGDITSMRVGKYGTLNIVGIAMLLFKIDEKWALSPVLEARIEYIRRCI